MVKSHPNFTVCVDSPLANEATKIFSGDLRGYLDSEARDVVSGGDALFTFPGLTMTATSEESKMLNMDPNPKVIISASGLCDAGRIRHHLKHNLWRKDSTIVFVGYQAEGTLGRRLLEGTETVKMFGEEIAVHAKIYNFKGLSSHADRDHLLEWIEKFTPKPMQVFVVHGDAEVTEIFTETLHDRGFTALHLCLKRSMIWWKTGACSRCSARTKKAEVKRACFCFLLGVGDSSDGSYSVITTTKM